MPPPNTVTTGFVCPVDGMKFLLVSVPGATPTARHATARQRAVMHARNEHRGHSTMLIEEFTWRAPEHELKLLAELQYLPRYYHNNCGEMIQNLEQVMTHQCDR